MQLRVFFFIIFLQQTGAVLELTIHPQSTIRGANTLIPCTFQVDKLPLNPKYLAIAWYFQGEEILSYDYNIKTSHPRASLNTRTAIHGIASLSLSNVTISDSGIYKCSVIYSPDKKEKEVTLDVYAIPKIIITNNLVAKKNENVLNCTITGFYPIDIDIKWLRDQEVLKSVIYYTPQRNSDGTYSVNSSVIITPTKENENQTYSIRVLHASLQKPLQKDFQLVYGVVPSIHMRSTQLHQKEETTLICQVWGFYPESISVNWYLNGALVKPKSIQQFNGSFLESVYQFTQTTEHHKVEMSCEVEHATLSKPLVEKLVVQLKGQWKLYLPNVEEHPFIDETGM
ncbi:tyrosine-protein phosphatase non-receptor type substrate 1-like [Bombina bombina]|uniref:tyrosine-protein phosphatase non-receptor type substrate 1-like n=1 Tax=Bombina bombina TaxID=8345 RepID=UPI00235B03CA|nr:tyrosine-protein phosphatase non-receptor type substrate 1-like [Bombina bombina]